MRALVKTVAKMATTSLADAYVMLIVQNGKANRLSIGGKVNPSCEQIVEAEALAALQVVQ